MFLMTSFMPIDPLISAIEFFENIASANDVTTILSDGRTLTSSNVSMASKLACFAEREIYCDVALYSYWLPIFYVTIGASFFFYADSWENSAKVLVWLLCPNSLTKGNLIATEVNAVVLVPQFRFPLKIRALLLEISMVSQT